MDEKGLRAHWLIGVSDKRQGSRTLPKGRAQIGKFGIGKLATFVLANRLTHITKRTRDSFRLRSITRKIPSGERGGIYTEKQIALPLRELNEEQAKAAVGPWLKGTKEGYSALRLFGPNASASWTVAIMSELKDMATDIQRGRLRYVLATAMPLRDDFKLFLNGDRVLPAKLQASRYKSWIIGKQIKKLPKPAPQDLEVTEDENEPADSPTRYGLTLKGGLGRVTGYVEIFKDLLTTGKSADLVGRSHGFFVYVRGRLINIDDE